jgi:hypothetical protein
MSYQLDLDEYTTARLREELENSSMALSVGRCDYCGRLGNTNACRFPERHALAAKVLTDKEEAHRQSILNSVIFRLARFSRIVMQPGSDQSKTRHENKSMVRPASERRAGGCR